MARGAARRGKRIAFGDGLRIKWDHLSEPIFRGNPNVAPPGSEGSRGLEWIHYCRGHRIYATQVGDRWVWNFRFSAIPGEMYFADEELRFALNSGSGFVLIEPNLPPKMVAPNKRWDHERWQAVADLLVRDGHEVCQFVYPNAVRLKGVRPIASPGFREACAALARAALYIGPEGGLHHASAAVGIGAVVLFGGFIPPQVTGYAAHTNLTGGATLFCGSLKPCPHCRAAMDAITVEHVYEAAKARLRSGVALAATG